MAAIKSRIDTRSDDSAANAASLQRAGRRPAREGRQDRARRRRQVARAPRCARQAAAARARRPPARSRHAVPRARAARRATACTTARRRRPGMITGIGRVAGQRMRDRRQRRDGEGRHLLPDDGQEAPARAGDRAAEPPAVHLPGRLRRRLPAAARTRSSPTATTSAASSSTRPTCQRAGHRRRSPS